MRGTTKIVKGKKRARERERERETGRRNSVENKHEWRAQSRTACPTLTSAMSVYMLRDWECVQNAASEVRSFQCGERNFLMYRNSRYVTFLWTNAMAWTTAETTSHSPTLSSFFLVRQCGNGMFRAYWTDRSPFCARVHLLLGLLSLLSIWTLAL